MPSSYPFDMYSGIFEPKHYDRIGSALWLFIWCISSTTREEVKDDVTWGLVLGNKPVKLADLAEPFGVDEKTVSRWIKTLVKYDYLKSTRTHHGLILKIKNSKKFLKKTDKIVQIPIDKTDRNVRLQEEKTDIFVRCNKDVLKILIDRLIDDLDDERLVSRCGVLPTVMKEVHLDSESVKHRFVEIEQYFNQRKGRLHSASSDWPGMQKLSETKIPLEFILFGIDLAFARKEKTKQWATDTIGNFAYCLTVIDQSWNKLLVGIRQIEAERLPDQTKRKTSEEGSGGKPNRQQRQLSLLDQLAEEEKRIEQGGSERAAQAN
jgi:DNA-binding MarR family transcriptional regulator